MEKDFWVWLMLRELFALPKYGDHLTFKGGTSLSKAWGLIDRFSEDIDLTVERGILGFGGDQGPEGAKSRKEQQRRIERLKLACREMISAQIAPALNARLRELLAANESWSLTADDDDPDGQTLLFAYPRVAEAAPSYLMPVVKLEFGARADPWPVEPRTVTSIVSEVFPALMETPACTVRALRPERTFWEKVMLLHEETFRPLSETRRPRMARHYYHSACMSTCRAIVPAGACAREPRLRERTRRRATPAEDAHGVRSYAAMRGSSRTAFSRSIRRRSASLNMSRSRRRWA